MSSTSTLHPVQTPAVVPTDRRSGARKALDWCRVMSGFGVYGALGVGAIVVSLILAVCVRNRVRRRHLCQGLIHRGIRVYARYTEAVGIFGVEFPEAERLRAMRGTIFAPNHATLMDATHFLARLPRLVCVMKKSIAANPFMGVSSCLAGYLPMDVSTEFIRRGRDALLAGDNLLMFPEGTRTVEPPVNRFKNGFALMASLADAPVQTVFIETPVLFMGKRWPWWKTPPLPLPIRLTLGERFRVLSGQSAKAFGAELEAYFRRELTATVGGGVERQATTADRSGRLRAEVILQEPPVRIADAVGQRDLGFPAERADA